MKSVLSEERENLALLLKARRCPKDLIIPVIIALNTDASTKAFADWIKSDEKIGEREITQRLVEFIPRDNPKVKWYN
jgi:hypothetical protein